MLVDPPAEAQPDAAGQQRAEPPVAPPATKTCWCPASWPRNPSWVLTMPRPAATSRRNHDRRVRRRRPKLRHPRAGWPRCAACSVIAAIEQLGGADLTGQDGEVTATLTGRRDGRSGTEDGSQRTPFGPRITRAALKYTVLSWIAAADVLIATRDGDPSGDSLRPAPPACRTRRRAVCMPRSQHTLSTTTTSTMLGLVELGQPHRNQFHEDSRHDHGSCPGSAALAALSNTPRIPFRGPSLWFRFMSLISSSARSPTPCGPRRDESGEKDQTIPRRRTPGCLRRRFESGGVHSCQRAGSTVLDVRHIAATPVGMKVFALAKILKSKAGPYLLAVEARDEHELIGDGLHQRVVVNVEKST